MTVEKREKGSLEVEGRSWAAEKLTSKRAVSYVQPEDGRLRTMSRPLDLPA